MSTDPQSTDPQAGGDLKPPGKAFWTTMCIIMAAALIVIWKVVMPASIEAKNAEYARLRDEECVNLVRDITRYKRDVAADYELTKGQEVHLQLLRTAGLNVDRIVDGHMICPHGKVIEIGVTGTPPTPACPWQDKLMEQP